MALYCSTSGSSGGGGGGGATFLLGGGGGAREAPPAEDVAAAGLLAGVTVDFPGNGLATGLGLEALGFWEQDSVLWKIQKRQEHTSEGPPLRRSLPCVIGLATPSFRLGGGLDKLLGGSPDATCTV